MYATACTLALILCVSGALYRLFIQAIKSTAAALYACCCCAGELEGRHGGTLES